MPGSHLTKRGRWYPCRQAHCDKANHVDLGPEEIKELPYPFVEQLIEIINPPTEVTPSGDRYWYLPSGRSHRGYDMPAIIRANGTREWYRQGLCHRDGDKPARIHADGTREWLQDGVLHREPDEFGIPQPARIYPSGDKEYYKYGWRQSDHG